MRLLPRDVVATAALMLMVLTLGHSSATVDALAQRNIKCDDLEPLASDCKLEGNLETRFKCTDDEILARMFGCFICVDKHTCLPASHEAHVKAAKGDVEPVKAAAPVKAAPVKVKVAAYTAAAATVKRAPPSEDTDAAKFQKREETKSSDTNANDEFSQLSLPFIPDALSVAESAQFNGADISPSPETVASWPFMAPAMLALVSIGVAVRSRVLQKRGEKFERIADCERDDEINPFCSDSGVHNPQDDDEPGDVEFTARFTVASDDDDSGHEEVANGSCRQDADEDSGGETVASSNNDTATDRSSFAIVVVPSSSSSTVST